MEATISITPHDCIASPFTPTSSSTRLSFGLLSNDDQRSSTTSNDRIQRYSPHTFTMLFSQASLLLALSTAAAAAPYEKRWFGGWGQESSSNVFESFLDFGKRHSWRGRTAVPGQCNLAAVQMPQGEMKLHHISIFTPANDHSSTQASPTAIRGPLTIPRCRRPRNPKLHLRSKQLDRRPRGSWCRRFSLQRDLYVG